MSRGYPLNIEGQVFNNWYVLKFSFVKHKKRFFKCKCIVCLEEKNLCGTWLKSGKIKSCNSCFNKKIKNTLKEGFEKFVIRNSNGCWDWKGCTPKNPGYGQFRSKMKLIRAHRASWILHFGEIPKGLQVLHKCDNKRCSNPEHLYLGTSSDNNKDILIRNRCIRNSLGRFESRLGVK